MKCSEKKSAFLVALRNMLVQLSQFEASWIHMQEKKLPSHRSEGETRSHFQGRKQAVALAGVEGVTQWREGIKQKGQCLSPGL